MQPTGAAAANVRASVSACRPGSSALGCSNLALGLAAQTGWHAQAPLCMSMHGMQPSLSCTSEDVLCAFMHMSTYERVLEMIGSHYPVSLGVAVVCTADMA